MGLGRKIGALSTLTASVLAGIAAQEPPRDRRPPARSGSAVVRGRVVAGDTGTPIRDAFVGLIETKPGSTPLVRVVSGIGREAIERAPMAGTSVDADGRFELRNLAAGRYILTVRPGPASARYLGQRYPDPESDTAEPLELTDGRASEVTIALQRAGAIAGRVYDERGDPLAFAQVGVIEMLPGGRLRSSGTAGILSRASGRGATSDDNGAFRLFSLPAGSYLVVALPMFSEQFVQGRALILSPGRLPIYYPGTANAHEASLVSLPAGGEASIEFAVPTVRTYTLRGTVIDPAGALVPSANVTLRSSQTVTVPLELRQGESGTTREDGTFSIAGVTPGEKIVSVVRRGVSSEGVPRVEYARMPLTIERDMDVAIQLRPSATVQGIAIFEGGEPASDERVTIAYRSTGDAGSDGSGSVQVTADRTFALEHLVGPMLVRTSAARWHLKSVTYGQEDITDTPTEFRTGDSHQLTVTLSRQLGVVSGTVMTSSGMETEGRVVLFSADRTQWHDRYSTTKTVISSDGKFRVEGLKAGRYLAAAVPLDEGDITNTPVAFYELLAKAAVTVTVGDGQSQTVNLKVSRLR